MDSVNCDSYTQATSPACSALAYIDQVIGKQDMSTNPVVSEGDVPSLLCKRLLGNKDAFLSLWVWTYNAIESCLLASLPADPLLRSPSCELWAMIDHFYWILTSQADDFWKEFSRREQLLRLFTRMWFADLEHGHSTRTLPSLIVLQRFTPEQLISATGATLMDVAHTCLSHIELSACQYLSHNSRDIPLQLRTAICLAYDLSAVVLGFRICLISCGMIPRFLKILDLLVDEYLRRPIGDTRDDDEGPGGSLESIYAVTRLCMFIAVAVGEGPLYLNYALDAGLLPLILSTHGLWKRPGRRGTQKYDYLGRLGVTIVTVLESIQKHVFHLRALRHMRRSISAFPDKLNRTPSMAPACPFAQAWESLFVRIEQATEFRIADRDNLEGRPHPCDNPNCPRPVRQIQGHMRLFQCSRCLSQRVCSLECQRAAWGKHRAECESKSRQAIEFGGLYPFLLSTDVTSFYQSAVQYFAVQSRDQFGVQYRNHRGRLHFVPPNRDPTYAIKVDLDNYPPLIRAARLEDRTGEESRMYFLDHWQRKLRERKYRSHVLIYGDFTVGSKVITVFTTIKPPGEYR